MAESSITAKGQTTVPADIRALVDAKPGTRLGWSAMPDGSLFSAAELTFESERALEVALQLFRKGSADFADCIHVALATQAGELPLWTFDKEAARVSGAQLLAKA